MFSPTVKILPLAISYALKYSSGKCMSKDSGYVKSTDNMKVVLANIKLLIACLFH
jgi:hypothetical protein